MKKSYRILSAVLCLLLLLAAALPAGAEEAVVKKITLSQKKATLYAGREGITLTATLSPEAAAGSALLWSSSKPAIAAVVGGVVTPLAPGKATITCKAASGKAKATCAITVKPVGATSLTVEPSSLHLKVGESANLAADILPLDATYRTPSYKSASTKIAKVDKLGVVTAIKAGKTSITVSLKGYSKKVKIPVVVEIVPVTSLTVAQTALELEAGKTGQLTATVLPADATFRTALYKSGNTKIAKVSASGLVTAVRAGTTAITVSVKGYATKITVPVVVKKAEGGDGGKLTATVTAVRPIGLSYGRTGNNVISTVTIRYAVDCSSGGTATLTKSSRQTSSSLQSFAKYDFTETEEISLSKGTNTREVTLYSSPWTYSGTDAPLRVQLTVTDKNGAKSPLTYNLQLYALQLSTWVTKAG